MTGFIFRLTLRQQLFRKSTILLLLLAALPVLVALLFRLTETDDDPQTWTAEVLFQALIFAAVLPLTALMYGTSVIGDEIEDGTAMYLLAKPLERWQILVPKILASWLMTSALAGLSVMASGFVAIDGGGYDIVLGATVAAVVAGLAYTVLFVLLSVTTTHALIAGLCYIFIWENAVTALFEGMRYVSIRDYAVGIADWVAGQAPETFDASVDGITALFLVAIFSGLFGVLANRRLQRAEIRERT